MHIRVLVAAAALAGCVEVDEVESRRAAGAERGEELAAALAAHVRGADEHATIEALAAVLDAIDRAEIEQAHLALARTDAQTTLDFADLMIRTHRRNRDTHVEVLDELDAWPRGSAVSAAIASDAQLRYRQLVELPSALDNRYLLAEVESHAKAQVLIEAAVALAPGEYATFVEDLQAIVDLHVEVAAQLARD